MSLKISNVGYVTLNTTGYENEIAIPTGKVDGDKAEVYAFMFRGAERKIWIQRTDIFREEHLEQMKLI